MLLFYQEKLLTEKNKNNFFWHWYEQQEIFKNGLGWEKNFYRDLKKELSPQKQLKNFLEHNPKEQTIVLDKNVYFPQDKKQKKIIEQQQVEKQYRAEAQKQFQAAAKKQYEIKIQKQQKEGQKEQQKRKIEQQQIQAEKQYYAEKQYHAEMQFQMQKQTKKQYQEEIQKQQKNQKQEQDQFYRQSQMQFQEQLKKDKKQNIWEKEQQKIKQEQQGYFVKVEKGKNNKKVEKIEDLQKNLFYFWTDNFKEQKENSVFWYANALQQQNQKDYFTKNVEDFVPEEKEKKMEHKTMAALQDNGNHEANVTEIQNIQKLYGKTQKNVSIWKKEGQQKKLKEKAKKETIQNMINESLKQTEQPKKQQNIAKVSQNINVDTLLFHLTEKLLEERERSLRGNKKI